jgi:cysteinyl-tRNA synthetase
MKILGLLLFTFLLIGYAKDDSGPKSDIDHRQEMRDFVQGISAYAKGINSGFIVIPQNGPELVTLDGEEDGPEASVYLAAIDGVGREDLYYGYSQDNQATPTNETTYMEAFLDICESNGVEVLITDYCSTQSKMDDSYTKNENKGYTSFAAPELDLNVIPTYPAAPYNENADNITSLAGAKNFLYLLDPESFGTKTAFINAVANTNFDALIIDLFFDEVALTSDDVTALSTKQNGGSRLVIAYMRSGEAENYRYYWESGWKVGSPAFIKKQNPAWAGNFKVQYWDPDWQAVIYGNDQSYLKKILDSGFDGVYLDIIDAFEYFE